MNPCHVDPLYTLYHGDALEVLKELPNQSVHCCVTSPPYWGLRDYGTATWEGGNPDCDHRQGRPGAGRANGIVDERFQRNRDGAGAMGGDCAKCGAIRIDAQLGLEKTPDEYVAKMVEVFREVRRVLRDDGTLWLNLGDTYARDPGKGDRSEYLGLHLNISDSGCHVASQCREMAGLKPKDMVGIPWRVAFALQSDGWYLRSDIIWHKPNPMPESVTDRPTKAHEYIFLLSKSERYHYDAEAIKEPSTDPESLRPEGRGHRNGDAFTHSDPNGKARTRAGFAKLDGVCYPFRNKRSVWTVATSPYPEAHFATYPPDLIKPCILAGCPIGGIVLDPFAGSGTTGQVAIELGRKAVLIELNAAYLTLIQQRLHTTPGLRLG